MHMYKIIEKKKNKLELTKEEIAFFVNGYVNDEIPDYQMASLLMAIVLNGMTDKEIVALTLSMANSGDKLSWKENSVDKHSTGGVGDKTTLIIAPIVSCLGCQVIKMSGRALGYTGGTIDKLESIRGFKVQLDEDTLKQQLEKLNIAIISQTKNIAPADKKIYALRDVTATVESIPLIASSIMSKKIASGAKNLVLDVKVGSGAFMKNITDARLLAKTMVMIGKEAGIKTVAVLSNMDQPLGQNIGNQLEVQEAVSLLNGNGPSDLRELSITLASYMVSITKNINYEEALKLVVEVLQNKKALQKFNDLVSSQGGTLDLDNKAKYQYKVLSNKEGYITKMDTATIGKISGLLGAGRLVKEDKINYYAGIILNKKINDYVYKGDLLATLYTDKEIDLRNDYLNCLTFSNKKVNNNIILEVIRWL
mgnify:FL=1